MWGVWIAEGILSADFGVYGVFPRKISGLVGIFLAPFIHGDLQHIMSNTPAIIVLGTLMRYFYPSISKSSMFLILFFSGIGVWIFARPSYHIGASGLVYGFAFFLFFSSVFRNDMRSLAISFFVILFYGSIVWGLLPMNYHISFESHIAGAVAGSILAYTGRHADVVAVQKYSDNDSSPSLPSYRQFSENKENTEEES